MRLEIGINGYLGGGGACLGGFGSFLLYPCG